MAKIALILGPEFEDAEFRVPYDRLTEAGHQVTIIGPFAGEIVKGKRGKEQVEIEASVADQDPTGFDAMVIPGGHAPDKLRTNQDIVSFVARFNDTGKTLAAVCHGPQLLIEAKRTEGRTMTSWPSVKQDLQNAGVKWVDEEVVEDGPLITSRKPDDLEAFSSAILRHLDQSEKGAMHATG